MVVLESFLLYLLTLLVELQIFLQHQTQVQQVLVVLLLVVATTHYNTIIMEDLLDPVSYTHLTLPTKA